MILKNTLKTCVQKPLHLFFLMILAFSRGQINRLMILKNTFEHIFKGLEQLFNEFLMFSVGAFQKAKYVFNGHLKCLFNDVSTD